MGGGGEGGGGDRDNTYLVGSDKLSDPGTALFQTYQLSSAGNTSNLFSTPLVYIRKVHQNTSGSAVSELMRFIHHIITYMYVVPAVPRAINWARPLIQKPPVTMYMYMILGVNRQNGRQLLWADWPSSALCMPSCSAHR